MVSLLEAARWAASSSNEQPWYFLVAMRNDQEAFQRTAECLVEFNRGWAQHAGALLLTVAHTKFAKTGKPNHYAAYDLGQAAAHIAIQATELGLATHQMAGLDPAKAHELFSVPEDYEVMTAIAVGYQGAPDSLVEPLKSRETSVRTRKPLEEFVFTGMWGKVSPLVSAK